MPPLPRPERVSLKYGYTLELCPGPELRLWSGDDCVCAFPCPGPADFARAKTGFEDWLAAGKPEDPKRFRVSRGFVFKIMAEAAGVADA